MGVKNREIFFPCIFLLQTWILTNFDHFRHTLYRDLKAAAAKVAALWRLLCNESKEMSNVNPQKESPTFPQWHSVSAGKWYVHTFLILFGFSLCWNTAIPEPMNMGIADRPTPHSHLRVGTWGKENLSRVHLFVAKPYIRLNGWPWAGNWNGAWGAQGKSFWPMSVIGSSNLVCLPISIKNRKLDIPKSPSASTGLLQVLCV